MAKAKNKKHEPIDRAYNKPTLSEVEVQNPFFNAAHKESKSNPVKIKASINTKESYVTELYAHKRISPAEFLAAQRVCRAFEDSGGTGAKGMDYEKTRVDGGSMLEPISEKLIMATVTLNEINGVLGNIGYDLTIKMAGMGMAPSDFKGLPLSKQRYLGQRFRECLETLSQHWGYATFPVKVA